MFLLNLVFICQGLSLGSLENIFKEENFTTRGVLRAAHPTANSLVFFGLNDDCVQQMCGLDLYFLDYIANGLNKEVRYSPEHQLL